MHYGAGHFLSYTPPSLRVTNTRNCIVRTVVGKNCVREFPDGRVKRKFVKDSYCEPLTFFILFTGSNRAIMSKIQFFY